MFDFSGFCAQQCLDTVATQTGNTNILFNHF